MDKYQSALPEPKYPEILRHWQHSRGQVNEEGLVLEKCDERFLEELVGAVKDAYEQVFQLIFVDIEESDSSYHEIRSSPTQFELILADIYLAIEETVSVLLSVAPEIRRLQRYQSLYPTEALLQMFICSIRDSLTVNHQRTLAAAKKMQHESCWEKIHRAERVILLAIQRPTFQPHLKPWQQFLINDAPGSGINARAVFYSKLPEEAQMTSEVLPDSAFQILPVGAMALLGEWRARARDLERRCRELVVPGNPQPRVSENTNSTCSRISLPSFDVKHETLPFAYDPNIWLPRQPEISSVSPTARLEDLSLMIDQIENLQPRRTDAMNHAYGVIVRTERSSNDSTVHHELPLL
ncbi:hypothetical protein VTN02DRAFT_4746 [Thermoascus thermophilus]